MYTCDCKVLIGSHPNPALESAWWDSQLSGASFGAESWFQHLQSWGEPFSLTFANTAFDLLATISIQNQFVSLILWIYIGVRTISNAKIYSHPSLSYSEVVYPPVPRNCRVKPVNQKYRSHLNLCFALYWLEQFLWFLVMAGTNNLLISKPNKTSVTISDWAIFVMSNDYCRSCGKDSCKKMKF